MPATLISLLTALEPLIIMLGIIAPMIFGGYFATKSARPENRKDQS
jgi:hypothetical protein